MTDTTAPRTAAGQRLLDVFAPSPDAEDDPRHAMLLRDILAIEAEAIEPLLALVRAAQFIADRHVDSISREAARDALAALPESIRAAARKPE